MQSTTNSQQTILRREEELDHLRESYKSAVAEWIGFIREEAQLAGPDHSGQAVDIWEQAHFKEEAARRKATRARHAYQDGLREILFHF